MDSFGFLRFNGLVRPKMFRDQKTTAGKTKDKVIYCFASFAYDLRHGVEDAI